MRGSIDEGTPKASGAAFEAIPDITSIKSGFAADLICGGKIERRIILAGAVVDVVRETRTRGRHGTG